MQKKPDMDFSLDTCGFIRDVLDKCKKNILDGLDKSATIKILDEFAVKKPYGEDTHVRDLRDTLNNKDTTTCLRRMHDLLKANPDSYVTLKSALAIKRQDKLLETIEKIETTYHDELKQKGQNQYGCRCTDDSICTLQEPLTCPVELSMMKEQRWSHLNPLFEKALRHTKEYMYLINEWIPKREITIREIETVAMELQNVNQKVSLKTIVSGAAAITGTIVSGGLFLPGIAFIGAEAVMQGANSTGTKIEEKYIGLLKGKLESAQNVLNKESLEEMNGVKSTLDSNIRDIRDLSRAVKDLSFERIQCSLLMVTMIKEDISVENPIELLKDLMTLEPFPINLSELFGEVYAIEAPMTSTEAEMSIENESLIAMRRLCVMPVLDICKMVIFSIDYAKDSPLEAPKRLGKVADDFRKQLSGIKYLLQEIRSQTDDFKRKMSAENLK